MPLIKERLFGFHEKHTIRVVFLLIKISKKIEKSQGFLFSPRCIELYRVL